LPIIVLHGEFICGIGSLHARCSIHFANSSTAARAYMQGGKLFVRVRKRPFLEAQVGKLTRKEKNLERAIQAKCYDCMGFYEDGRVVKQVLR